MVQVPVTGVGVEVACREGWRWVAVEWGRWGWQGSCVVVRAPVAGVVWRWRGGVAVGRQGSGGDGGGGASAEGRAPQVECGWADGCRRRC